MATKSVEDCRQDVIAVEQLVGPRGGSIMLMTLACQHRLVERREQPRRTAVCLMCWAERRKD